jgi:hypothetical protein
MPEVYDLLSVMGREMKNVLPTFSQDLNNTWTK